MNDETSQQDDETAEQDDEANVQISPATLAVNFWVMVWLGTSAAGGLFGLLLGCFPGLLFGIIFAAMLGVPVVATVAIVSWALWLSRYRLLIAGLAGAATGVVATLMLDPGSILGGTSMILLGSAGLLGGLGAAAGGGWYYFRTDSGKMVQAVDRAAVFRFSLRDLFIHITVVAALLGVWVLVVKGTLMSRERAVQDLCENNLKSVWLAIENYHASCGSPPPAYLVNEQGARTLSWRVLVAPYSHYSGRGIQQVDSSQTWDSPVNATILSNTNAYWLQCQGIDHPKPGVTNIVAVVGPGTLWPGEASGDGTQPERLLLVEWPDSDINWAEPRDLTVEEFLDWFRPDGDPPAVAHPGGLLTINANGEVHALRRDTDVETVRKLVIRPRDLR